MSKSPYVRLNEKGVFSRDKPVATYQDISTLHRWIEKAGEDHAGPEKSIVDKLVEKNDQIIDLEMALPAWTLPKVAVRMDLVAIEDETVVFWEVKTVDDSRLRCRAEFEEDKYPEVLKQLSHYRVYLGHDSHIEQVESAYRSTAKILVKLRALADKVGPVSPLGASIIAASQVDTLAVARRANLVVVDVESDHPERTAWTSWKSRHEGKLRDTPMLVLELPALLKLKDAL
jgi:hypothetical protein